MKHRLIASSAAAAALALTLAGCSDTPADTTDTGATGAAGSGVTGSIKASGSSAQKNAMAEWINAFQSANTGATIDYQANGSGAGIQDFINNQTAFAGSDHRPVLVSVSARGAGEGDDEQVRRLLDEIRSRVAQIEAILDQ